MSQSNAIAGFIVAAFLIFITARGKLPAYAGIFVGASGASEASNAPAPDADAGLKDAAIEAAGNLLTPGNILQAGPNALGGLVRKQLGF